MEHGLGIVYGLSGPISLSAVFSSLVSSMGTTDVAGRDDGEMRSDCVHGLLKTTGMTTAPQFQLKRTSRGWVRRKKEIPSNTNRGAGTGHRNVVWSTLLSGFCWLAFAHCFPPRCADLGYIFYTKPLILEEVKRDVPLRQLGRGGGRGRRPPEYRTELVRGTRLRDVHGHKVPLGTSVGTLNKLIDK